MKYFLPKAILIFLTVIYWPLLAIADYTQPLDCDPAKNCRTIDPCKINPTREGCPGYKPPKLPTTPPPKLPETTKEKDEKSIFQKLEEKSEPRKGGGAGAVRG